MYLTITEAAKMAGVSRATLYKRNKEGKLSFRTHELGHHLIDPAELSRLYTLQTDIATKGDAIETPIIPPSTENKDHEILQVKLEAAEEKVTLLQRHIDSLQNTLEREQERVTSLMKTSEKLLLTHNKESKTFMEKMKEMFK